MLWRHSPSLCRFDMFFMVLQREEFGATEKVHDMGHYSHFLFNACKRLERATYLHFCHSEGAGGVLCRL